MDHWKPFRLVTIGCFLFLGSALLFAQNTFISLTPCRLVDTRGAIGAMGGPAMQGGQTRNFPLPSNCGVPSDAAAYSLNITVVPYLGGPLNYLSVWPAGISQPVVSTLNSTTGHIVANAAIVPAGVSGQISVYVTDPTDLIIDINGYYASAANSGNSNTSLGQGALPIEAGGQNTAIGFAALSLTTTGGFNTAAGSSALSNNTTGSSNTAFGQDALFGNSAGSNNTAVGTSALSGSNAGENNTAIGVQTLSSSTGNNNIAVGYQAGDALSVGNNNIEIGNTGLASDDAIIRIGTQGIQSAAFVAGIFDTIVSGGSAVVVDANGQLGIAPSSRRFKQDIQPMGDSSDALLQLQPVSFRYRQSAPDGTQPLQYGLIAEQVADVYPELAVYGNDGRVESVQYQQLPAMLLNEIQKQHQMIQDLEARIAALEQLLKANTSAAQ